MINKKGFVGDVLTWVLVVGVLILIVMIGFVFIDSASESTEGVVQESISNSRLGWAKGWDYAIVALFSLSVIATLVSAWVIGTNGMFFWISLITLIFFLLGTVAITNLLQAVIGQSTFIEAASLMPATTFIVNNIFILTVSFAFILVIVLFARNRME